MSSEVAKKRVRPTKVITDPVDVDSAKKATTRAKSTKATTKTTKGVPAAPAKATAVRDTLSKPAAAGPPTAPTTSKILNQLKELEAKKAAVSQELQTSERETAAHKSTEASKPQPPVAAMPSKSPDSKAPSKPAPPPPEKSTLPPPPSAKPTAKPHVPISQLNSTIASNIATRAGARPNTSGSQQLPKNYKNVARKVTMVIVMLPVAIVTSYILFQRLALGRDRKMLVPPAKKEVRLDPSMSAVSR